MGGMGDHQKVDALVVIAFPEEFNVLDELWCADPAITHLGVHEYGSELGAYYLTRSRRTILATYDNERDKSAMRARTQALLERHQPAVVACLGLSGALDDKLRLGHVVVATSCEDYEYRGKWVPSDEPGRTGASSRRFGGVSYETTGRLVAKLRGLSRTRPDVYHQWLDAAGREGTTIAMPADLRAQLQGAMEIHEGPIGSGSAVVNSPAFKEQLRAHDRNYLAVDTESAGVLAACKDWPRRCDRIVLRAISDLADGRKSEIDDIDGGAVRRWALRNAGRLLLFALDDPETYAANDAAGPRAATPRNHAVGDLFQTTVRRFELTACGTPGAFDRELLALIAQVHVGEGPSWDRIVAALRSERANSYVIDGPSGTGKSWITQLLYAHFASTHDTPVPFYVDFSFYGRFAKVEAVSELQADLKRMREAVDRSAEARHVLLIDNFDNSIPSAEPLFNKLVEFGRGMTCVVSICGAGATPLLAIGDWTPLVTMRSVPDDRPSLERLVATCARGNPARHDRLRQLLTGLDGRAIDRTVVQMITQYAGQTPATFSRVCEAYCLAKLDGLSLEEAAQLAIEYRAGRRDLHDRMRLGRLIRYPPILDFLQAWAILGAIRRAAKGEPDTHTGIDVLAQLYTVDVHRRCKEMMRAMEWAVAEALELAWGQKHHGWLPTLCYLAGRLADAGPRRKAASVLKQIRADLAAVDDPLFLRTLCLSSILLGEHKAGQQYLERLVSDREADTLNRGFHLEYYGDIQFDSPTRMGHEDDLRDCPKTFQHLLARITAERATPLLDIEAYTLCSLVRHRHLANGLAEETRAKFRAVMTSALERHPSLSTLVADYMRTTIHELRRGQDALGAGALLGPIYDLKLQRRTGWVNRGIADPESVAEHMYCAFLLGLFFLPEKHSEPTYDKNHVLRMILVHDIGEAITGDIPSPEKTVEHEEDERKWVAFLAFSSAFPAVGQDVSAIRTLYGEYKDPQTFNARVARDLDRLENLAQLHRYHVVKPVDDYDSWCTELRRKLLTDLGRQIQQLIDDRFKR